MTQMPDPWPESVKEAVEITLKYLTPEDQTNLRKYKKEDLVQYHMTWGMGIRNAYGLWGQNQKLLRDCGTQEADDASMKIMEAVWEHLQHHQ